MSLSEEQVKHVAKLASLSLTEDEVSKVQGQLNEILDYIGKLDQLDTRGIESTSHVHGLVNNFRDDVVKDSYPIETALKNSADSTERGFRVPKII